MKNCLLFLSSIALDSYQDGQTTVLQNLFGFEQGLVS